MIQDPIFEILDVHGPVLDLPIHSRFLFYSETNTKRRYMCIKVPKRLQKFNVLNMEGAYSSADKSVLNFKRSSSQFQ